MPRFNDPEPLGAQHELDGFSCGEPSLDVWLLEHARRAGGSGSARTFVVHDSTQKRVVGFYALTAAAIEREQAATRISRGMPRHAIPVVLLARLAVDRSAQRRGLGAFLLQDAAVRTIAAAEQLGIRALIVHALNDQARAFYLHHGFCESATDALHLMVLVKDLRRALRSAAR